MDELQELLVDLDGMGMDTEGNEKEALGFNTAVDTIRNMIQIRIDELEKGASDNE
jgi:hypothetical protein